jgi:hypothetical protein
VSTATVLATGLAAGARFRRFIDPGRIRAALLTAAASAIILVAHNLVG